MDVGAVDGEICRGRRTGACAELAAVTGPVRATELIYCWDPDGPAHARGFAAPIIATTFIGGSTDERRGRCRVAGRWWRGRAGSCGLRVSCVGGRPGAERADAVRASGRGLPLQRGRTRPSGAVVTGAGKRSSDLLSGARGFARRPLRPRQCGCMLMGAARWMRLHGDVDVGGGDPEGSGQAGRSLGALRCGRRWSARRSGRGREG
jgi:hypothetical protein